MSSIISIAALLVATSTVTPVPARESLVAASARSAREIAKTMSMAPAVQDGWARVGQLTPGSMVRVIMLDGTSREGRFDRVTDDRIVLTTGDFERDAIAKVQRPTRGSILGGVIGAAAGGLLGVYTAFSLAFKQCGESCSDEGTLMIASLVGMPIAGGYLGAKFLPRPQWTDVYKRR